MPFVDFVDEEDCEAVALRDADGRACRLVILNVAPVGGAVSGVLHCPPGARIPPGRWSADLEVLLLDGSATIDDDQMVRYSYLFVPAGVSLPPVKAGESGAKVLVFTSRAARHDGAPHRALADRNGIVGPLHAADMPWERPRVDNFPAGAARKTLRDNPGTGEGFWLLGVLPHWNSPFREWHTFDEENYILEGEIETAVGLMTPGSYLAHPAGEEHAHGPMRSRTGAFLLTRASGPLGNTYIPTSQQLSGCWP